MRLRPLTIGRIVKPMDRYRLLLPSFLLALLLVSCSREPRREATELSGAIVAYGRSPSGAPLRGVLYRPPGPGPFPVLLYAHGSAPGSLSNEAFEAIAPAFTRRGWALFAPYRRGQGLSASAGRFIRDEIAAARAAGGQERAQTRLAQLLATDHMADQAQAFEWLSHQPFTDRRRIATMGNSFGGIIALLSAERLGVCASVDAAGGADSWSEAPALREMMTRAAIRAAPPILFFQARNDSDIAPSVALARARRNAGRPVQLRLYPAFGTDSSDGHAFPYRGVSAWADDVHAFLQRACR